MNDAMDSFKRQTTHLAQMSNHLQTLRDDMTEHINKEGKEIREKLL